MGLIRSKRGLWILIFISTLIRLFLSASIELGNDEAYYWTYAKYPDLSHFDHPPMLGYFIQLFTLNLLFDSELALRLCSVVCGIVGSIVIYEIGRMLKNERAGLIAAILFTTSVYSSIISSVFIMPDSPLVVFWLLALYYLIKVFSASKDAAAPFNQLILAGFFIGLAALSKYQAAFLWSGTLLTIIWCRRKWLKSLTLYWAILITIILIVPIAWWNLENNFVSFNFHGDRVSLFERGIRIDYFFSELFGQILYNNPVNVVLMVLALLSVKRGEKLLDGAHFKLLLSIAAPLLLIILFFALFRRTLPHWTGPAHLTLLLLSAVYLESLPLKFQKRWLTTSLAFILFFVSLGWFEINTGTLFHQFGKKKTEIEKKGKYDVTLDLYGWTQFSDAFENLLATKEIDSTAVILSQDLYQSAHLDYYVARPLEKKLIAIGPLEDVHKYAWINEERGYIAEGNNAYFITYSRNYKNPDLLIPHFEEVAWVEQIPIYRQERLTAYFFVYYLKAYQETYQFPLRNSQFVIPNS